MQDRDIINDLMGGTKASINSYTMAVVESSNQQLRSTWQTLRTEAEQMHHQLYQMAEQKGYYMPAPPAHQQDVQKIKSGLSSSLTPNNNTGSNIYSTAGTSNMNVANTSMASSINGGMQSSASSRMQSSTSGQMQNMSTTNNDMKANQKKKNK